MLSVRDEQSRLKIKELEESRNKGRIVILMIFLITALISLGFWWSGNSDRNAIINPIWEGQTIKMVFMSEEERQAQKKQEETENFKSELNEELQKYTGSYGVYVYRLTDNYGYGINENEVMQMASIIKVPLMAVTIQEIEAGNLDYESTILLERQDKREGGPIANLAIGSKLTIDRLLSEMGKKSDNTAYAALLRKWGSETIQSKIGEWGMTTTLVEENTSTARDVGRLWEKLYKGEIITEENLTRMWEYLRESIYEDRISLGLPENTDFVHKVGTDEGVWADAGIVLGEKPFVVVIMTREAKREEAQTAVPEIAKMVWEFENKTEVN